MTVACWVLLIWITASLLFVSLGLWWVNRHPDDSEPCPVRALYPQPPLEGRATPQQPPRSAA